MKTKPFKVSKGMYIFQQNKGISKYRSDRKICMQLPKLGSRAAWGKKTPAFKNSQLQKS